MGIKERHERERDARRRAILDAARELFTTDGYRNVSMRKIAERIEYSPAALYSYFPSKDDIFFALAEDGFERLAELGRAAPEGPTPLDTLRTQLHQLYQFSVVNGEHYALMFLDRSVPRIRQFFDRFPHLAEMRSRMADNVAACVAAGQLPTTAAPTTVLKLLITAVHGAALTRLANRLSPDEDAGALARDLVELVLAGLRAGTVVEFRAAPLGACGQDAPADASNELPELTQ